MSSNEQVTVQLSMSQILTMTYWGLLGVGGLLLLLGSSNEKFGYLIAACFLGIAARIVQAEHHHRSAHKLED